MDWGTNHMSWIMLYGEFIISQRKSRWSPKSRAVCLLDQREFYKLSKISFDQDAKKTISSRPRFQQRVFGRVVPISNTVLCRTISHDPSCERFLWPKQNYARCVYNILWPSIWIEKYDILWDAAECPKCACSTAGLEEETDLLFKRREQRRPSRLVITVSLAIAPSDSFWQQ